MSFRDKACERLSRYRRDVLGLEEEGIFSKGGREYRKGHVLPIGSERRNLLEPYGSAFFCSEFRSTKLHQYFHHLNSSQALCINLFYPLLFEGESELLRQCLGSTISAPVRGKFEAESDLEVATRRTSFDFLVRNNDDQRVLVEVKYTEEGFGGAPADDKHLNKFQETYAPMLKDSEYLSTRCNDPVFFLKNYQILRNLVHLTPHSEVRFLFPRANAKVAAQAEDAKENLLTESGRSRFGLIYLEDLVPQLIDACRGRALGRYYEAFAEKYLNIDG